MKRATRIKICGITRAEDAWRAAIAGTDAIGLVFHENSPRYVTPAQADAICRRLPAFVTTVALFQDAGEQSVREALKQTSIDLLQFHGHETAEFCRLFNKPYIKALAMGGLADKTDVYRQAETYHDAKALVLDSHAPGEEGGTGRNFDWIMIPDNLPQPVILAGGLNADNVAEAIRVVQPYAVDVSSGVESEPGMKSVEKISAFIKEVKNN